MSPNTLTRLTINLNNNLLLQGLVVAAYGKRFDVEISDGKRISCVTRGKKTDVACGDFVILQLTDKSEGVIDSIQTRKSLLFRSNAYRSKMLASNVTQAVIVLATVPSFYEALLNRCLIATEVAGIKPLIVLNKCDLGEASIAMQKLELYRELGYRVQALSAKQDIEPLKQWLKGETSVLVGQSGMGKSTIINALIPHSQVRTQEVSQVLDSGKHTTTAAHLYHLDANSDLIDSPGLQEFGLNHLSINDLEMAFVEFRPFLGKCRFNNCKHKQEPDCAIIDAVAAGLVTQQRLSYYQAIAQEIS
jgi:ribosome biogenesis GTPase / thiamine phosphate phosphatase